MWLIGWFLNMFGIEKQEIICYGSLCVKIVIKWTNVDQYAIKFGSVHDELTIRCLLDPSLWKNYINIALNEYRDKEW